MQKSNKWEIAFQTWYGYFECQMILFDLTNAPESFQGYVKKILAKKLNILVIVYLDNIFIYTKDPEKCHVKAV